MPPIKTILLALLFSSFLPLMAAEYSIEKHDDGVAILIDGTLFTKYITNDPETNKPYFYPVIGPTGKPMTRSYPMEDVEGEAQDHPHHRSLWFGHQFIDDFDTWHEKLTLIARAKGDAEKLAELEKSLGSTKHREILEASASGDQAVLRVTSEYLNPSGKAVVADERTFTFRLTSGGERIIDVDIIFTALNDSVSFADAKDAGLSLRVAQSLSAKADEGGRIVTSDGAEGEDAWGKRAPWCDFNGPVDGKGGEVVGIAMFNHPSSFRYPTPWHVRTYGLFTANPFGLYNVAGEGEDTPFILKKGESFTMRHRILFHRGDEKAAKIADAWEAYSKTK